jgi:8-oxo-dGTP diphosphatase
MIEVTAAIIMDNDKILICQRPKRKKFADFWEFPGGKTEPGETSEECVIRECHEELTVTIETDKLFADITKDDLHITFFICRITDGTITLKEHQAAIWITKEELSNYTFCPADTQIVEMLKES